MVEITTIVIIAVIAIIAFFIGIKYGSFKREQYWIAELPGQRQDAILKSRSVLGGHFSENLAPYLPNFPFLPTECRFMGKPIDFIVFKGMDSKNIDEVIFVEVKSGNAKINSHEKNLKDTIDKKKVRWVEYRIPKELTDKGDIEDKVKKFVDNKE